MFMFMFMFICAVTVKKSRFLRNRDVCADLGPEWAFSNPCNVTYTALSTGVPVFSRIPEIIKGDRHGY